MIKREGGFTLLEMLIVLSAFLVVVSFVSLFFRMSAAYVNSGGKFNRFEWLVFNQQAKVELRETKEIKIVNSTIYFYKQNGEKVTYEKYGSFIRRRVNDQGHEIMLQHISSVFYSSENQGLRIRVMTDRGDEYETFIASFFPVKVKAS
ncbi:competence type IV pilus minor pilin ComGF [Thermolongibacillus altinsuensis]|jgi:competence protein ComGF|uniref:competence type IV pilus minor pilin ComGF n=1 Tax=Thermolongibacillus altinsuensis TaxID=575256 RepID=UPI00242A3043|nr:competence type IV pilus minor pilin ComGF [Thermolongibacillus altinsuensis]GMB07644.1 hypothetical protein B1no1_03540 [Thermolongibacillus altinsuensis]